MVRFVAGLIAAIGLAGCGAGSGPDPAGTLVLNGAVLDPAGAPLRDASVTARPALTPQEVDTSRLSELDALGFACIDERPPAACRERRHSAATGEGGEFALRFGVTEALGGQPAVATAPEPLTVAVHGDPGKGELSGFAVSRRVVPDPAGTELGAFTAWEPALELATVEGGDAVLRWEPEAPGRVATYRVLVEGSEGRLVWQETTGERELRLTLPNLEGTRGAVSVVALAAEAPERWRSARIPYRADDGSVRPAAVDEVDWPLESDLPAEVLLAAIVSFFFATLMLLVTTGARHRRRLALLAARSR